MTFRDLREQAELTQAQLAERAGVEQTTISQLELGKVRNPKYGTVEALALALGKDVREVAAAIAKTETAA